MDTELSMEMRIFLFNLVFTMVNKKSIYLDDLISLVHESEDNLSIKLEHTKQFDKYKNIILSSILSLSYKGNSYIIHIDKLLSSLKNVYFLDSKDNFYGVLNSSILDSILTINLTKVSNITYLDSLLTDMMGILISYMDLKSIKSLCKFKHNFCKDVYFLQAIIQKYPKNSQDILEEYKKLNILGYWVLYEQLYENDIQGSDEIHFDIRYDIMNKINNALFIKNKYPYYYDKFFDINNLAYSNDLVINTIYYNVDDNTKEFVKYLQTGILLNKYQLGFILNHGIIWQDPRLLFDLLNHPSFNYETPSQLFKMLVALFSDLSLFRSYINKLHLKNPSDLNDIFVILLNSTRLAIYQDMKDEILKTVSKINQK